MPTATAPDSELVDALTIARWIGVPRRRVYGLVERAGLPAYRVGGQWRFDLDEVNGWLRGNHTVDR